MEEKPFVMYSPDDFRKEALLQSAFVQKMIDSKADLSSLSRPEIDSIHGAATAVISYTKDGSPHLDIVSSKEDILEGVKMALEKGTTVSPLLMEASEPRKLSIMEEELEAIRDVVARAKVEAEEALNLATEYEGRGFTEAPPIPLPC
ncbi:MAG: hypothetical protein D4R88_01665 [Methanosarcinales archaeon]|nr:MAG: hypothetical protein D4R88_01665 [Methanosarcinales archaeon]